MCGLSGVLYSDAGQAGVALQAVQKMSGRMRLRGPDADGTWRGNGVVLGHRRLAIQDLDVRSNQPFVSADKRYVIVFNGEIYNFHVLRQGLQASGEVFRTSSDTEVLLALFVREGAAMLPKLRGMFAFAVWDVVAQSLFLARDPYGIKPLFYSATPSGFVFASQVKALQASGLVATEIELAGLAGFYLWGSVPAPWTLYRDVFALLPGHYLQVQAGRVGVPVCWQDIRTHWQGASDTASAADVQTLVRQAVTDSVQAHLVADVPVGGFLSGGIDSGVMVGLTTQLGARVEGITISFAEFAGGRDDEAPVAAAIAAQYGLPHRLRQVTRAEFEHDVPLILDAMDQPTVDGVNTWFASKAAAECGYKVVLSGVGGDELFCGYPSFDQLPRAAVVGKLASALSGCALQAPFDLMARLQHSPKLAGVPAFMGSIGGLYFLKRGLFLPSDLPMLMGPDQAREGLARLGGSPPGLIVAPSRDGASAVGMLESVCYLRNQLLPDSDWASMAHSLELRTPLVDAKLLATLGTLVPSFTKGRGKNMLAMAPLQPMPDSIIHRPKTGFSTPMAQWLQQCMPQSVYHNINGFSQTVLTHPTTPWARRWAVIVASSFLR
jgi:asparagine synthase (glutamine-hydrolysing)